MASSIYRAMHHMRKGGLHDALHIPKNEKIPQERLEAASKSKNKHVQHMANMAKTMEHFKH